ncbi:hypothetical protein ACFW04_003348 [Cataglyphis niger]
MQSLSQLLISIQTDLSKLSHLPDQVNYLEEKICNSEQYANEQAKTSSGQDKCGYNFPHQTIGQTMTACTLKIKNVIPNIPNYDDYKISILQFTRACESARDAYQVIEGKTYTNITDLLDKLKFIFASFKSAAQYRGELANTYKLPNKTILKYAERVKDLKTAILDGHRCQGKKVLEAFINGLPSEIITRIEYRQPTSLDEAIEWAVNIFNSIEMEKQRERRYAPKQNFL